MLLISLRAARINSGFTLKQVAARTGRCAETISKYELDSTSMPRDVIEQLVGDDGIYGIPKENIFFGKQSVFTEQRSAV